MLDCSRVPIVSALTTVARRPEESPDLPAQPIEHYSGPVDKALTKLFHLIFPCEQTIHRQGIRTAWERIERPVWLLTSNVISMRHAETRRSGEYSEHWTEGICLTQEGVLFSYRFAGDKLVLDHELRDDEIFKTNDNLSVVFNLGSPKSIEEWRTTLTLAVDQAGMLEKREIDLAFRARIDR